jgi:ABC-type polar amino acid transport system ATPase subunit
MFRIEQLRKSFGELQVLRGVTLTVPAAGVTCLTGPSGAGKSTLLRCMSLLEPADGGRIVLEGNDVTAGDRAESIFVRRRVGIVFQEPHLFQRTALENVMLVQRTAYGRSGEWALAKSMSSLERVGLIEQADVSVERLSSGERLRVGVARALALGPHVVLFEDVTSRDPELVSELLEVVRRLAAEGMTMVVVTREIDVARALASRVALMDGGVIVAEGPPAEVLSEPREDESV